LRILIALNDLSLGGTQMNALDFASSMLEKGHDVLLCGHAFGGDSSIRAMAADRRLPLQLLSQHSQGGARVRRTRLTELAREFTPDIINTYETRITIDVLMGPFRSTGTPVITTWYAMGVPPALPRALPIIVGTPELVHRFHAAGFKRSMLVKPPVNTFSDAQDAVTVGDWRAINGADGCTLLAVLVTRLESRMKGDSLRMAVASALELKDPNFRLAIVGSGPASEWLVPQVSSINESLGWPAISLHGPMMDPRPVYAAADVVLGMGTSVLRGMAFGSPAIVLGTEGFVKAVTPDTWPYFAYRGMWGIGSGDNTTAARYLAEHLRQLADPNKRAELGEWSRRVVVEDHGLSASCDHLLRAYRRTLLDPPKRPRLVAEGFLRHSAVEGAKAALRYEPW
jgi:hypothetical protein